MDSNRQSVFQKLKKPYGFVWIIVIDFTWYILSEIVLTFLPGEWPAIIWIPFHFIINPFLGIVLSLVILLLAIINRNAFSILIAFTAASVMTMLSIIGFTGHFWLIEMLGLKFHH